MSHEVETMAYANEVPWHGLGARVDGDLTPDEMLKAAGLDWEVELWPMQATNSETGQTISVKDRFALVRSTDQRVLTITGKSWHPLQNRDTLGLMKEYVAAGGATLETAGSLREGKIVWGLARLNHDFDVTKGDRVNGYLLITSPHEVGKAITVRTTTVRVVCANTLAMAEQQGSITYRQNHLSEFDVNAAQAAIGASHEQLAEAERRFKTIQKMKLSVEDAITKVYGPVLIGHDPKTELGMDMLKSLLQPENQSKDLVSILDSYRNAPGAEPGTGWGALNAVTHWADHVKGREAQSRMFRSWIGDTGRIKLEVEKELVALAA